MSHNFVQVQDISPGDIGTDVRFYAWDTVRETGTVITSELRQIKANSETVILVYGVGAGDERVFQFGEVVNLNPSPHYDDVPLLVAALATFHALDAGTMK